MLRLRGIHIGCKLITDPPLQKTPSPARRGSLGLNNSLISRCAIPVALIILFAVGSLLSGQSSAAAARYSQAAADSASGAGVGVNFHREARQAAPAPLPSRSCVPAPGTTTAATASDCVVSLSPDEAFNQLGTAHTVTFLCGSSASSLTGPVAAPYPTTGCFNVSASVVDETAGNTTTFTSVICGGRPTNLSETANCSTVYNPICAAGNFPSSPGSQCAPCPSSFTFTGTQCITPVIAGVCPPGTTEFPGGGLPPIYCFTATLSSSATNQNEVLLTLDSGAPHAFLVDVTGYVGTEPSGACPVGTTLVPAVTFNRPGGLPPISGPACHFDLRAEKKYVEGTHLEIVPLGPCGGGVENTQVGIAVGTPCFFTVKATGTVILKTGVQCDNGTEPTTGTEATSAGFPVGSTYECLDGVLSVVDIPMAGVLINLQVTNGIFNPSCIPPFRLATPTATAQPTDTPVGGPFPTDTPTDTPTPSPTPTGPTDTPTPITRSPLIPAACGPPGTTSTTAITNNEGTVGHLGGTIEYNAVAMPQSPVVPGFETITGRFFEDLFPVPGVHMFSTLHYPGVNGFCDSGVTDGTGTATCTTYDANAQPGVPVNVDVDFMYNCGDFPTTTSFLPVGPLTPTATPVPGATPVPFQMEAAPNGICVVRLGFGDLIVSASFTSALNTQPSLSTGPVVLGGFTLPTPAPTETPTSGPTSPPGPTATNTLVASETPTITSTSAPTETPTETPIPTATKTATPTPPPAPLQFRLDAAKVTTHVPKDGCKTTGLDAVMHGQTVCLEIFYTISSMPGPVTRSTTYEVRNMAGRVVFRVQYAHETQDVPPSFPFKYARYQEYTVPNSLPFGVYEFRGTLTLGGRSQTRQWRVAVVRTTLYTAAFSYLGLRSDSIFP